MVSRVRWQTEPPREAENGRVGFVESVASGAMSVETSRGALRHLRRLLGVWGVESGEVELMVLGRLGWILRLRKWVTGGGKDGVGGIGGDELADAHVSVSGTGKLEIFSMVLARDAGKKSLQRLEQ